MSHQRVGHHLRHLTKLFAALLPACGQSVDEAQFTQNVCVDGAAKVLASTSPAVPVDYVAMRQATLVSRAGEPEQVSGAMNFDEVGQPCATAVDMTACLDAVANAPYASEFLTSSDEGLLALSLLYTRGDLVGGVRSFDELAAYLGDIDTPGDAALIAVMSRYALRCDAPRNVGPHPEGYVVFTRRGGGCGEGDDVYDQVVLVRADGSTEVIEEAFVEEGDPACTIGRLPAGLCRRPRARAASPVGTFLAQVAELEAASVHAFTQLAHELALHRAPRSLIRAALTAAGDEVRHARTMTRHARRYGGRPKAPVVTAPPPRALVDIALDNAVEGCVRETFGAASAHLSARTAEDRSLRADFATIAREETQHAALSWALHEYFASRLSPRDRARVERHRRDAATRMERELTAPLHDDVHVATGIPRPREARRLYRGVLTQRHQST